MFDISFGELALIGLVALVVLGPERLPKVARTAGHLMGRLQRYVSDVKADINREMQLEELKKLQQSMETSAREVESSLADEARAVESSLKEGAKALEEAAPPNPLLNPETLGEPVEVASVAEAQPPVLQAEAEPYQGAQLELAIDPPKQKVGA